MTSKYPAWTCRLVLLMIILGACAPAARSEPAAATALPSGTPRPTVAPNPVLATPVPGAIRLDRRWYTTPDGLFSEPAVATVLFAGDVAAGSPRVRLDPGGRETALVPVEANRWTARLDLAGLTPGTYRAGVVERVAGADTALGGPDAVAELRVSAPEYVVWTLDFEGDESDDAEMANTAAIADGLKVPMSILWNPRAWSSAQVRPQRAEAMLAWTKERQAKGDEVGLHIHLWTDWVRAAGVAPRVSPAWAGRPDGYDVPLTAYPESEVRTLLDFALRQMSDHGLPRPTSFRAGGHFADATTVRALVAAGFTVDCTAVPAGSFGRLRWPWTLPVDAQPYYPSAEDASKAGNLPILESPTIGGNTYGYTVGSMQSIIRADLAMLAPAGQVAIERRTLDIVSHPGTIVPAERAAIESLFRAFGPLRYDADVGPLRFVTLRQLAKAYAR